MRPLIRIARFISGYKPLCRDCYYYKHDSGFCSHPYLSNRNLVDGTKNYKMAYLNRETTGKCGPTGDYWKSEK